ncbi:OmpP1/FadL family transporter [Xanthomarina sp. F2636L]|uniref:OmpP1/FadL family transporter n=1 Tax=Xanthomarina sp. F2636L TaxID=2996018 RepID=UPI00225E3491|nr:transporter [Xanthomarina sp. F2636L]MCX7551979.1 transporter [Xanthomarina sp. F2636L]
MKKLLLLFIGILAMTSLNAQDVTDAVRYTQDEIQGTARYRGLSGAFGALGGDMSAVSINPAGSAIFNSSHISLSLSNNNIKNETQYFNGFNTSKESNIDLNQSGATFVFYNRNSNSDWSKFAFSAAYDKVQNYNNDWLANGSSNTSIDRYFLDITEKQNVPFGVLKLQPGEYLEEAYADIGSNPNYGYPVQQVFLGYWAGIIDPVNMDNNTNDDNIDYFSNTAPANSYYQEYYYASSGYNGKFSLNFATAYKDRLYLGVNLNSHFINYDKFTSFYETNLDPDSLTKNIYFENWLSTFGSGFSFQLGAIAKITKDFRMGLSYSSPTWYRIEEELIQGINSNIADSDIGYISNIINIYPSYNIQTPGKFTGSLAYIFGEYGLISFDYSLKDYGNTKFKPNSDAYFSTQNRAINNQLTTASTYKVGGELRLKQVSLRGGYRFEESPYKNGTTIGDLNGYSLGLGYNFGNFKLDMAFDQAKQSSEYKLYSNSGFNNSTSLDSKFTNVTFTVAFNL